MKELIYIWTIENIEWSWQKTGEKISSAMFLAKPLLNTEWKLHLYPRGEDDCDYLCLELRRGSFKGPDQLAVNVEFSCLSSDTLSILYSSFPETSMTFYSRGYDRSLMHRFLKRCEVFSRKKSLYLANGNLTLRCRIWMDGEPDEFEEVFARTHLMIQRLVSVEFIDPDDETEKTFYIKSKTKNEDIASVTVSSFSGKAHVRINPINEPKMKFYSISLSLLNWNNRKLCEHESSSFGNLKEEKFRLYFSNEVPTTANANPASGYELVTGIIYSTGKVNELVEKNRPTRLSKFVISYMNSLGFDAEYPIIFHDLNNLFRENFYLDLKLKTDAQTLLCNQTMLCAHSEVFAAMLTHDMIEKANSCVEIKDISAEALENFLSYLHFGYLTSDKYEAITDLHYVANKYGLNRLKAECCLRLLQQVSIDNIIEILLLSKSRTERKLEQKILKLISEHEEEVFNSSTWKKFASEKENYEIALEVMRWKYDKTESPFPEESPEDWISSCPTVQENFRSLYESRTASDVLVRAASRTFPAHKTVLSASSDIFREQITSQSTTDGIDMTQYEDDVVSRMLVFFYSDSLEGIQRTATVKLYQIAIVKKIRRLRFKTSCLLLSDLNTANSIDLLLLAHENNDDELKSVVEDYICQHDDEIFGSGEWAKFSETHLPLAHQTMLKKYEN